MELWFVFMVVLVAGLGIFAMLGYVKNETDKMELKHLLVSEQFRRQIAELEGERNAEATSVAELTRRLEALQEENDRLHARVENLRRGGTDEDTPEAQSPVSIA